MVDAKGQDVADIDAKIVKGSTVTYGDKTVTVLNDNKKTGIDDADSTVISADKAVELMTAELTAANKIGVDDATSVFC